MIIYYIIGLEGTGHHGLEPVITDICKNYYGNKYLCRPLLNEYLYYSCNNQTEDIFKEKIKESLKNISKDSILFLDWSFPSTKKHRTLDDISNIIKIYNNLKNYGEIKILHLERNLYNAINSRKKLDGNIINHAKKISDVNKIIYKQLDVIKQNTYIHKLKYEEINTQKGIDIISKYLNINKEIVKKSINKKFKMSKKDYKKLLDYKTINKIKNIIEN